MFRSLPVIKIASNSNTHRRMADNSERLGHKEFVPWRIGPMM